MKSKDEVKLEKIIDNLALAISQAEDAVLDLLVQPNTKEQVEVKARAYGKIMFIAANALANERARK